MSNYSYEPVKREPDNDFGTPGTRDTHPAFGVAIVTRGSSTGSSLFQSDLLHNHIMTLRIETAERARKLGSDWVHPKKTLVEVDMSLAQWGELVSSVGLGSGTPVTIRHTENVKFVPMIPHEPRLQQSLDEVDGAVEKMLEKVYDTLEDLQVAIGDKKGVKAVREAMHAHTIAVANAKSNTTFAVKTLHEAAEKTVAAARSDIEAHILSAQGAFELPSIIEGEIES